MENLCITPPRIDIMGIASRPGGEGRKNTRQKF